MLLSELDGGFSYLAFSVRRGNRLSVLLLFLLYLAYLLMASLLGKKEAAFTFSFYKMGRFYRGLHYAINIFSYCWRNSLVFC